MTRGAIGLTLGAAIAGPLGDRIGRTVVAIAGVLGFGLATLGRAISPNEFSLGAFRVIACLFLGAVMPLAVTLVAEFMPARRRRAAFALAAAAAWVIAATPLTLTLLMVLAFIIGVVLVGANSGMNTLSASTFPTKARATGISWMHSFGKAGSIVSGLVGGAMLSAGRGISGIFLVLGIPCCWVPSPS